MGAVVQNVGGAAQMLRDREARAMDLLARGSGNEIEDLTDDQFQMLLERRQRRVARLKMLVTSTFVEGRHFGKFPGVDKPFCWEPGADEIGIHTGWSARLMSPPTVAFDGEVMTTTAEVGIIDGAGRVLVVVPRSCSTREKRFRKKSGAWKFEDPRECANELQAMAFKRGKVAGMVSAAGLKDYFANPDQVLDDEEAVEKAEAERLQAELGAMATRLVDLLKSRGVRSKGQYADFVSRALGSAKSDDEFTRADFEKLLAAAGQLPETATKLPCSDCNASGRNDDDTGPCMGCNGTGRVRA